MTFQGWKTPIPDFERALREAKSLWNLIAHERVKERLQRVFGFGLYLSSGPRNDSYRAYSKVASRLQNSNSKTPSRELEEATLTLEDACTQAAFDIYEDEAPERPILSINLLWLIYSQGLVPFIQTLVLHDTCFRLEKAQPSLGINMLRPDGERFFAYDSLRLRKEFPVVIRIVDQLKARWHDKIKERAKQIYSQSLSASGFATRPNTIQASKDEKKAAAQGMDLQAGPQTVDISELQSESIAPVDANTTAVTGESRDRVARESLGYGKQPASTEAQQKSIVPSAEPPGKAGLTDGVAWEDVEILFLSDERVQIRVGTARETRNYAEFGFGDIRTNNPNRAWGTLRKLAENRGVIRNGTEGGLPWPKVEKRMQEIRRVFRKHFGVSSDPIPFVENLGYRARFKIYCGPSFRT